MFHGTRRDGARGVLAQPDQAAFDDPGVRVPSVGAAGGKRCGVGRSGWAAHGRYAGEVEEVRGVGVRVDEDGPAARLVAVAREQRGAEAIEDGLARVQPDGVRGVRGPGDGEAVADARGVTLQRVAQRVEAVGAVREEREDAVGVAVQVHVQERCRGLEKAAHVAGQQAAVVFLLHRGRERGQAAREVAPAEQGAFPLVQRPHLRLGQPAVDGVKHGSVAGHGPFHVVPERDVLEQPAHHVEHLVGAELRPNAFELVEQGLQDAPLARAAGDQVDDDDRVALLAVAVDAAHALFEPRRVPRYVVVHHQPAELEVDALAGGVGRYQIRGAAPVRRPPERGDLRFPRAVVEAAVDQGDPAGETQPFEPADEEFRGVAVLGEDDEFLAGEVGRAQYGAEFLEFGVLAGQPARLIGKDLHRGAFLPEIGQRQRDEAAQGVRLELLVAFASRVVGILVRGAVLEEVGRAAQPPLPARQFVRAAGAHQFDGVVQAFQATFERTPQRMGRTGLAALEHAHGQPRRGAVEDAGLVVRVRDVAGRGLVQALLRGAQRIAQGVAPALRIEGAAVEADHFFFGPADEVVTPPGGRKRPECLEGRQRVRHEQPPQAVVGEVLAHVRRRGQQQDVGGRPAQIPPRVVRGESGERLGEPVTVGLADGEIRLAVGGQFVGFVEHDEVVGPRASVRTSAPRPGYRC